MKRQWLKDIRKKLGLTQAQAAGMCGISQTGYSSIENGTRDPHWKTAKVIAKELGVDWELFFMDKEGSVGAPPSLSAEPPTS